MPYDGIRAADYASSHAELRSTGNCAKYVRRAIEWGGVALSRTHYAKDYGSILESAGFQATLDGPQKGDVVVIQPVSGHPAGYMAIYDGTRWISDFKQRPGAGPESFYPGPAYRSARPSCKIYRYH